MVINESMTSEEISRIPTSHFKTYFSFDKEHHDNTKIYGNEETIVEQLLQKCGVDIGR